MSVEAVIREARLDAYRAGLIEGCEMVLDHLSASPAAAAPSGVYCGPLPDELREWIAALRARLDQEKAERKGTATS